MPDPSTGQLTTVFDDLPQSPFTEFDLHFFGSERGLLATPTECGTYAVNTEFVPWATELPNQTSTQFFSITSGPTGAPAPAPSPPVLTGLPRRRGKQRRRCTWSVLDQRQPHRRRSDAEYDQVNTPPGLSATLKGVPSARQRALPDRKLLLLGRERASFAKCPPASQIGRSWTTAGASSRPYTAPGKVYLSGPYKGAPLSFAVVTPVIEGPYDLGNVVNRIAVRVDPLPPRSARSPIRCRRSSAGFRCA